jgi:hypothetical protein
VADDCVARPTTLAVGLDTRAYPYFMASIMHRDSAPKEPLYFNALPTAVGVDPRITQHSVKSEQSVLQDTSQSHASIRRHELQ